MSSPLPPLPALPSSHTSSSSSSRPAHRKSSGDKPGLGPRTSSSSSLHRSGSSKSNVSTATKGTKHHSHVVHTSHGKHHRTTSFGHRVPSYGKGLNKLTALTTVTTDEPKEHVSGRPLSGDGGVSMQRSLSEGNTLVKKERRPSSSSVHNSRPRVRKPNAHVSILKQSKQHVTFSTRHSSDEEDDDIMVHRKSDQIVTSPPQLQGGHPSRAHHASPAPTSMVHRPPMKSGLKEGLSSAPKFLQKSISQVALVPPEVSVTNALSKDISTSADQSYPDQSPHSAQSEPLVPPSSNPTSHFLSQTPPSSRTPRTPDFELGRNQSTISLAHHDNIIPLATSQGKLTRTQQKLLLQRASTQPNNLPTSLSSPSLTTTTQFESTATDYFSPLPTSPHPQAPPVTMSYDIKVAREFERISRELVNARRFGNPTGDAIQRLHKRISPSGPTLSKKSSAFGLSMNWKRSPDKDTQTPRGETGDMFAGERQSKVREVMRRMWFDGVDGGEEDDDEITVNGSRRGDGE